MTSPDRDHHPNRRARRRLLCGALASRRVVLAIGLAVVPALVPVTPELARGARTPGVADRATPDPLPWGIYEILWSPRRFPAELDRTIRTLGASPDYVLFFRDLARPYPTRVCDAIVARGAVPVISIEVEHWGGPSEGRLDAIVAGEYDAHFLRYARDAREGGHGAFLRFGFEMNGDWFPWGGQPATFIAAWRHLHEVFGREGHSGVRWVWAPNAISGPDAPDNGIEKYWPGDDVVDVIGLDGYNFGDGYSRWHTWQSCEEVFRPALDKIVESGVPHPVLITEFGCTDEGPPERRAAWIRDAYAFFRGRPEVRGVIWFNFDKRREREPNWRIDADAASLDAWRSTFGRPPDRLPAQESSR